MAKVTITARTTAFSRTRKVDEQLKVEFKPTHAIVHSESGREYTVTRTSCTCEDHFYRKRECRHMLAVKDAVQAVKYW